MPPPVLPGHPSSPLRIKPRSRSRHGSASSASEPMTAEATGYEADLDNADKEKDCSKSAMRPPPLPPPPPSIRKISSPPARPSSPLKISSSPPISTERSQPDIPAAAAAADAYGLPKNICPNLPSLSPVRPNFPILEEGTLLLPVSSSLPTRPGLDIGGEPAPKLPQQYTDSKSWKVRPQQPQPQPQQQHPKLKPDSPRDEFPFPVKEHRVRDEVKPEEEWTLISSAETESNTPTQESRVSPTTARNPRQHDSPVRYVPPGPYPARLKPPRPPAPPSRHVVPANYLVSWKGEEAGNRKNSLSSPIRLGKGVKSMENIRAAPYAASRRPLPVSRPTHGPHRENNYYNGVPKSYEPSRTVRPLPLQGSTHSSSLDLGQHNSRPPYSYNSSLSPNNEPLARPQSASGENTTSPSNLRHPNDLLDNARSPQSISPHHAQRTLPGQPPRHHPNDRSTDCCSGAEILRTSPPRSPASPQSPQYTPHSNGVDMSKHGVLDEDELSARSMDGSNSTVRQDDRMKMSELISNNSESTLISARLTEADKATPPSPSSTTSATTLAASPGSPYSGGGDDSDSSEFGTMIWKKRPEDGKLRGPPLTVQIVNPPEDSARELLHRSNAMVLEDRSLRASTFTNMSDSTWAPRPLPEDVYDRLEDFFPEHDLDKPVIEASSGSTSPTVADPASSPVQSPHPPESLEKKGIRARKSIRYVAEDFKKRIDRKPSAYANIKRNTKLWGSRVEEVTTAQPRSNSISSESSPSSAPSKSYAYFHGQ